MVDVLYDIQLPAAVKLNDAVRGQTLRLAIRAVHGLHLRFTALTTSNIRSPPWVFVYQPPLAFDSPKDVGKVQ